MFADEAEAMLNTWGDSYLRDPGLRVLYLVPPEWIKEKLNMNLSVAAEITRVFIGRIEVSV